MIDNAMKELEDWVGNNHTELADWAKDARSLTEEFKAGDLSEDEYLELMKILNAVKRYLMPLTH